VNGREKERQRDGRPESELYFSARFGDYKIAQSGTDLSLSLSFSLPLYLSLSISLKECGN
jgi:hypothetical protein